ncbi:hypothetical protein [Beijerinckia sp. L45]|uniref:hypothetical protein n=1 Tax=Beijerinckia sp. L45 TaxID=1641855 RepID=UPI00131ECDD8|nr:hypothetical protein [Beijerinckia sp. L45]
MTTLPDNIVEFNALAGRVLVALFVTHPMPIALEASTFFPIERGALVSPGSEINEQWDLFENTVAWLRDEGYLRYAMAPGIQSYNPTFQLAKLTEKGMSTLTKPLPALASKDGKKTIGEQLVGAAKSAAIKGAGTAGLEATKFEFAHIVSQIFS